MRVAPLLLLAVFGLAACDVPTAPERVNPYDPVSGDGRIPTPPDSLRLASSTPSSVTLTWRDASSFDTAVRVERAVVEERFDGPVVAFEAVATLPAGATTYTDSGLTDSRTRIYRLVALAGGVPSAPSAAVAVAPPVDRRALTTSILNTDRALPLALSTDGATLYALVFGEAGLSAFDARTGALRGRVADADRVAGVLDDGRVALRLAAPDGSPLRVAFVRGASIEQTVTLASGCSTTDLTISADGSTAAATCSGAGPVAVWRLPSGDFVRTVGAFGTYLRGLSPNGGQVYTAAGGGLTAWRTATGAEVWRRDGFTPRRVAPSPDGARLLVAPGGTGVLLLDAATGATLATDPVGVVQDFGPAGAFSPDGQRVAYPLSGTGTLSGTRLARVDGLAREFDLLDPPFPAVLLATDTGLTAVGFVSDGTDDIVAVGLDLTRPWREVPVPGAPSTAFAHGSG